MATLPATRLIKQDGFECVCVCDTPQDLLDRVLACREDSETAQIIKQNPKRTVFRLEVEGTAYYVKWHRFRGIYDAVAALFRGTRARREWKNLLFLRQKGIPTVAPVLLGRRRRFGLPVESILVTAGAAGRAIRAVARELAASRRPGDATRTRRLAEKAGGFVRKIHDAGLDCPDLHSENLLVVGPADALCLLDLHSARQSGTEIAKGRRMQNLGFLCNSFNHRDLMRTHWLRFVRGYLGPRHARFEMTETLSRVAEETRRIHERHLRSRSKRCLRRSSVFTSGRTPLGRVYRQRAMSLEQVFRAVELHKSVLSGRPCGEVAKREKKTSVTLIDWDGSLGADRLCVKEFVRPAILLCLPSAIRHRNAMISWKASLGLRVRTVAAPEALAVVIGKGARSYLIMHAVESAERLYDYVPHAVVPGMPVHRRRAFIRAAAEALKKMYAAGVAHDDMKSSNVVLHETAEGGWEFGLLDLDAVRFPKRITMEDKILNLAQLNAAVPLALTWTDRLRFLRHMAKDDSVFFTRATMRKIGRLTRGRTCIWT